MEAMIVSLVLRACGIGRAREILNVSDAAQAFSGKGRGKPFRADQNEMTTRGAFSAKAEIGFADNAAGKS
jgi:hypothetical protein